MQSKHSTGCTTVLTPKMYIFIPQFIFINMLVHKDFFHISAVVNGSTIDTVCMSFLVNIFVFLGYMPNTRITVSYLKSVFNFFEKSSIPFSIVAKPDAHVDMCFPLTYLYYSEWC